MTNYSYEEVKKNANTILRNLLSKNPKLVSGLKGIDIHNDPLILLGKTYGYGDDGLTYYKCQLLLDLDHLEKAEEDLIYLMIQQVPIPDTGDEWNTQEFSDSLEINFTKAKVLATYMEIFMQEYSCEKEIRHFVEEKNYSSIKEISE